LADIEGDIPNYLAFYKGVSPVPITKTLPGDPPLELFPVAVSSNLSNRPVMTGEPYILKLTHESGSKEL